MIFHIDDRVKHTINRIQYHGVIVAFQRETPVVHFDNPFIGERPIPDNLLTLEVDEPR